VIAGRPRLLVLDPSANYPETEGAQVAVGDWPGEATILQPVLKPEQMPGPGEFHDVAGIVLMGSAASVHDDDPWLERLSRWLAPVVSGEVGVPLLGICFGHQLLAHLAGGRVRFLREDRKKLVGIRTTTLRSSRLLPGARSLQVVVSHREEVTAAPPGFRVTASRPDSKIDGLEHETLPLFSCQFHPEARTEFARSTGIEPALINEEVREQSSAYLSAFRRFCLSPK
jgi:GMP synthase-like glutamine amidotransferase